MRLSPAILFSAIYMLYFFYSEMFFFNSQESGPCVPCMQTMQTNFSKYKKKWIIRSHICTLSASYFLDKKLSPATLSLTSYLWNLTCVPSLRFEDAIHPHMTGCFFLKTKKIAHQIMLCGQFILNLAKYCKVFFDI